MCKGLVLFAAVPLLFLQYGDMTATLNASMVDRVNKCQPINITCRTENLQSLNWYFDDTTRAGFTFNNVTFPHPLDNSDGVDITVTNASAPSSLSDAFNGTSVLATNTLALSLIGVNQIQCGTFSVRSQFFDSSDFIVQISPTVNCFLTSSSRGAILSIQWSPSFTSQHAVERYRVSVFPDPSSCSSDQVNPNQRYTCSGLVQGIPYNFNVSAILNCGGQDQEGQTSKFSVEVQAPQISDEFKQVLPIYDQDLQLRQVFVEWNEEPQSHISANCSFNQLNYTVNLEDRNEQTASHVVQSADCSHGICSTALSIWSSDANESYRVSIAVSNGVQASDSVLSNDIAGSVSNQINVTSHFQGCFITFTFSSNEIEGNCGIAYGQDPSYQDLSQAIEFTLSSKNSLITLPLMEPRALYYFLVNVSTNSSHFQIRGNFTVGEFSVKLSASNTGFVVVGVMLFFIAISVAALSVVIEIVTKKGSWLSLVLLVVGVILIVVCAGLWAATWAHVMPQENTCESAWQSTRNIFVVTGFVFSLLALLSVGAAAVLAIIAYKKLHLWETARCRIKIKNLLLKCCASRKKGDFLKLSANPEEIEKNKYEEEYVQVELSDLHRGLEGQNKDMKYSATNHNKLKYSETALSGDSNVKGDQYSHLKRPQQTNGQATSAENYSALQLTSEVASKTKKEEDAANSNGAYTLITSDSLSSGFVIITDPDASRELHQEGVPNQDNGLKKAQSKPTPQDTTIIVKSESGKCTTPNEKDDSLVPTPFTIIELDPALQQDKGNEQKIPPALHDSEEHRSMSEPDSEVKEETNASSKNGTFPAESSEDICQPTSKLTGSSSAFANLISAKESQGTVKPSPISSLIPSPEPSPPPPPKPEKSVIDSLQEEEKAILRKFLVDANVIRANSGESSISVNDALKCLEKHNFNAENALEEIENPAPKFTLLDLWPFDKRSRGSSVANTNGNHPIGGSVPPPTSDAKPSSSSAHSS